MSFKLTFNKTCIRRHLAAFCKVVYWIYMIAFWFFSRKLMSRNHSSMRSPHPCFHPQIRSGRSTRSSRREHVMAGGTTVQKWIIGWQTIYWNLLTAACSHETAIHSNGWKRRDCTLCSHISGQHWRFAFKLALLQSIRWTLFTSGCCFLLVMPSRMPSQWYLSAIIVLSHCSSCDQIKLAQLNTISHMRVSIC